MKSAAKMPFVNRQKLQLTGLASIRQTNTPAPNQPQLSKVVANQNMPENANVTADNQNLPLELWEPKSVFNRVHTPEKVHHRRPNYCISRGIVVRTLDMRHAERKITSLERYQMKHEEWAEYCNISKRIRKFLARQTVAYPSRQRIIHEDPFGMNCLTVGYSFSKKKRWLLEEYFKENAQHFQFPDEKISTILATTEYPFFRWLSVYPELFRNHNFRCYSGTMIKSLVYCDENGDVTIREHKCGRGKIETYLPPFDTTEDQTVKPNRKLSKRKRRLTEAECNEDPVRVGYYVHDPKVGPHFINATQQSRENCRSTYCGLDRIRKNKPWHPEEDPFDSDDDDLKTDYQVQNDELELETPSPLTLADFLDQPTWDWLQWESEFVFVASQINENFSIDDYVFEDIGEDWDFC